MSDPDYIAKIDAEPGERDYTLTAYANQIPWIDGEVESTFQDSDDESALAYVKASLRGEETNLPASLLAHCREYGWLLDVSYRVAETPILPRERK